jgi:hypothetical protein
MAGLVAEMAVGAPVWEKGKAREAKPAKKRGAKANAPAGNTAASAAADFAVVEGAEISKTDAGYVMRSDAEGFVLKRLDQPFTHQATIRLTYQGAGGGTRNACLAFGAEAKNESLIKAGTMIGMHQHGIFQGPWSQVKRGKTLKSSFDPDAKFDAAVTIDLDRHIVTLVVDDATVETSLPPDLKEVRYIGYYTKGASSNFGPMKITNGGAQSNGK